MRYYTIKILTATDGTEVRDLRGFDTLDEALVRYHTDLQANISKCKSVYCAVINGVGGVCTRATLGARRLFRRKRKRKGAGAI